MDDSLSRNLRYTACRRLLKNHSSLCSPLNALAILRHAARIIDARHTAC